MNDKLTTEFLDTLKGKTPHYRLFEINKKIREWKSIPDFFLQVNELTVEKYRTIKRELLKAERGKSMYELKLVDNPSDSNYQFCFTMMDGSPAIKTKIPKKMFETLEKAFREGKFIIDLDEETSH